MCGFRPLEEIQGFFKTIPELAAVCDQCDELMAATQDNYEESLRKCFESLMLCSKETLQQQLQSLNTRITSENKSEDSVCELFLRLHDQYPGDVGCFVIFFLNHLKLSQAQAMLLERNVPHAYLYGEDWKPYRRRTGSHDRQSEQDFLFGELLRLAR